MSGTPDLCSQQHYKLLKLPLPALTHQQVTIFNAMGFPYVRYQGCPAIGITLRADPSWRSKPVYHFVVVK